MIEPKKEFARLMDARAMQAVLEQCMPEFSSGEIVLTGCTIQHPRYKTYLRPESHEKSFLSVSYHLHTRNRRTEQSGTRILYARAYLGDRSRAEYEQARAAATSKLGALVHFPELGIVGWTFPDDPSMPWLREVIDPRLIVQHLPYDALGDTARSPCDVDEVAVNVVNYRPEIRCTIRYDVRRGSRGSALTLYGKTFADHRASDIYERMGALFHRRSAASFLLARPLRYDPPLRTIWQQGLEGEGLLDVINTNNAATWLSAVAEGLVSLHRSELTISVTVALGEHMIEVRKKAEKLIHAFPQHRELLHALAYDLESRLPGLRPVPQRVIHGDFHIQQLLVIDGKLALFDFDELAMGDPLQDVANFIADLHVQQLDPGFVRRMSVAFFGAYRARAGSDADVERFVWHLRVQLITRAYRAYIQQKPELEAHIGDFLRLAEQDGCGVSG